MEKVIQSLLNIKNYEDLIFIYVLNSDNLEPFPKFLEKLPQEDRLNILQYIVRAKTPISVNLRKIMLSRFFYEKLYIDEIV